MTQSHSPFSASCAFSERADGRHEPHKSLHSASVKLAAAEAVNRSFCRVRNGRKPPLQVQARSLPGSARHKPGLVYTHAPGSSRADRNQERALSTLPLIRRSGHHRRCDASLSSHEPRHHLPTGLECPTRKPGTERQRTSSFRRDPEHLECACVDVRAGEHGLLGGRTRQRETPYHGARGAPSTQGCCPSYESFVTGILI